MNRPYLLSPLISHKKTEHIAILCDDPLNKGI